MGGGGGDLHPVMSYPKGLRPKVVISGLSI